MSHLRPFLDISRYQEGDLRVHKVHATERNASTRLHAWRVMACLQRFATLECGRVLNISILQVSVLSGTVSVIRKQAPDSPACLGAHAYVQLRRSIQQPFHLSMCYGSRAFSWGDCASRESDHIQVATLYLGRTQIGCSSGKTDREREAFAADGR